MVADAYADRMDAQPVSEFRLAVPADAEPLTELIKAAYRGEASRDGWTSEADLVEGDRINLAQVQHIIARPESRMLVLDEGGGPTACCVVTDRGDGLAFFGTFAVSPKAQRGGIGRRLMAAAQHRAASDFGSVSMEITVLAQQTALLAWYERLGFRSTGERRPFPADPKFARPLVNDLHFVVLIKALDDAGPQS
jgi:ribosomal protein S18 acetylase RimI-like enzyme